MVERGVTRPNIPRAGIEAREGDREGQGQEKYKDKANGPWSEMPRRCASPTRYTHHRTPLPILGEP
jgi:hypothetical protein